MTNKKSIALIFGILVQFTVIAQTNTDTVPCPAVWYSFDGSDVDDAYLKADISNNRFIKSTNTFRCSDRFGVDKQAISFGSSGTQVAYLGTYEGWTPWNYRLFGYTYPNLKFPDNFTIACWVYFDGSLDSTRKIFFAENSNSVFAVLHKGKNIFLRRIAQITGSDTNNYFDYPFGAPASFDAGAGWYHIIFTMGKREVDFANFTKLYVGKPHRVKYDQDPPRIDGGEVSFHNDPLASDFGGAFAFTGPQDIEDAWQWGLGNADDNDPVAFTKIAAVLRIDDLAVWDVALTEMQSQNLFKMQRSQNWNTHSYWKTCLISPTTNSVPVKMLANVKTIKPDAEVAEMQGLIRVFPNPTSRDLWVKIDGLKKPCEVIFTLTNTDGKQNYFKRKMLVSPNQSINLGNVKSLTKVPGIYMLQVSSRQLTKTIKVILL